MSEIPSLLDHIRQAVGFGLRDMAYRLLDAACWVLNEDERAGIARG